MGRANLCKCGARTELQGCATGPDPWLGSEAHPLREGSGMRDMRLHVRPMAAGWRVDVDRCEPMVFLSGAAAEAGANALAARLAGAGNDAQVVVHDRTLQVVGTRRYFGDLGR